MRNTIVWWAAGACALILALGLVNFLAVTDRDGTCRVMVRGRVTDAQTGEPVPGADVGVYRSSEMEGESLEVFGSSDGEGGFSIDCSMPWWSSYSPIGDLLFGHRVTISEIGVKTGKEGYRSGTVIRRYVTVDARQRAPIEMGAVVLEPDRDGLDESEEDGKGE